MSNTLRYNNTIPGNIYYNNAKVQNVYYNNTKVWSASRPFSFTYTGVYEVEGDLEGNYIVRFKTSGTLTINDHGTNNPNGKYDIFLVGGGATNEYNSHDSTTDYGMGGGGGGYTATYKNLSLSGSHTVVIGEGGKYDNSTYGEQIQGKPSKFDSYSVNGGIGITLDDVGSTVSSKVINGGNGGSGGGYGGYYNGCDGGSDGSNGSVSSSWDNPGVGQGTTTREFGESTGRLYAGGGGGGCGAGGTTTGGHGGAGGGGNGFGYDSSGNRIYPTSGEPNTGGGGGGGRNGYAWPGNGGSGIVCLRNAR